MSSVTQTVEQTRQKREDDADQAYRDLVIRTVETGELADDWEAVLDADDVEHEEFTLRVEMGETIHKEHELRERHRKLTVPLDKHRAEHAERVEQFNALRERLKKELADAETSIAESEQKLKAHKTEVWNFGNAITDVTETQQKKIVPSDYSHRRELIEKLRKQAWEAWKSSQGEFLKKKGTLGHIRSTNQHRDREWLSDRIGELQYKLDTRPSDDIDANKWQMKISGLHSEIERLNLNEARSAELAHERDRLQAELDEVLAKTEAKVAEMRADWKVFLFY